MSLKETLTAYWLHIQEELLPWLDDTTCGPLNGHHRQLVSVLGMGPDQRRSWPAGMAFPGRPPCERAVLARAFIAKVVFNIPTTSLLIEMLSGPRQDVAPLMWLAARGRGAERVDVFAGFRGVRRERFAIAVARGADPRHPLGSFGRTYLT